MIFFRKQNECIVNGKKVFIEFVKISVKFSEVLTSHYKFQNPSSLILYIS